MDDPSQFVGQSLGHYRILELTGAGGMGLVFRAYDQNLERTIALKVLPPGAFSDENARKRLRKEAVALAKLNHPNSLPAFLFGICVTCGIDELPALLFDRKEFVPYITFLFRHTTREFQFDIGCDSGWIAVFSEWFVLPLFDRLDRCWGENRMTANYCHCGNVPAGGNDDVQLDLTADSRRLS